LGNLSFNLSIKVFKWSSLKPVNEIQSEFKSDSFSSNIIYSHSIPDLLKQSNCLNSERSECVLLIEIQNSEHKLKVIKIFTVFVINNKFLFFICSKAHNFMLLLEPKKSRIVKPNLKLVDVKQTSFDKTTNKYVYDIEMSSEAIAPFVYMDFKLGSKISGYFPDNGFFMFVSPKNIEFVTNSNITVQLIKDNLTFKTLTDV
jgi:hypothetical protein